MALLVAIASFKMTPIYEATVRLDVEADTLQIQSVNDFFRQIPTDEAFIGTQIQVLEGVSLAERTIQRVGLTKNPKWTGAIKQGNGWFSSNLTTLTRRACRVLSALSPRSEGARQPCGQCEFRERRPCSFRQSRKRAGG